MQQNTAPDEYRPSPAFASFSFGDLTRDEINAVMTSAGLRSPWTRSQLSRNARKKTDPRTRNGTVPNLTSNTCAPLLSSSTLLPSTDSAVVPVTVSPLTDPAMVIAATPSSLSEAPVPSASKPKSWAALFTSSKSETLVEPSTNTTPASVAIGKGLETVNDVGAKFTGLADILSNYQTSFETHLIQPRGLINNGNICYMNCVLQPLTHCPPFYNLVTKIGKRVAHNFGSKTPLLDAIIMFLNEFRLETDTPHELDHQDFGESFLPEYVYNALRESKRFESKRGRQEDAEEFMHFLLDGLHEEFITVQKIKTQKYIIDDITYEYKIDGDSSEMVNDTDNRNDILENGNGWLEVGPKKKTSSMRMTESEESPISKIFGGTLRSVLKCSGYKDSAVLEPFQSLPLDIQPQNVRTLEEALQNITSPETMHDYVSPKGIQVEATKQVYLEALPPVLIVHLKRFLFDIGGIQKLHKHVSYPIELSILPEWIAPTRRVSGVIKYKLFGVVYHHGKTATGGHYTCDIRRQNGQWLHVDDTMIVPIVEQDVTRREQERFTYNADRVAYLLFYIRA